MPHKAIVIINWGLHVLYHEQKSPLSLSLFFTDPSAAFCYCALNLLSQSVKDYNAFTSGCSVQLSLPLLPRCIVWCRSALMCLYISERVRLQSRREGAQTIIQNSHMLFLWSWTAVLPSEHNEVSLYKLQNRQPGLFGWNDVIKRHTFVLLHGQKGCTNHCWYWFWALNFKYDWLMNTA